MKIILIMLSLVSIKPWFLLTSIVALLKIKINNLKDSFLNFKSNNLSGYKILSKIYNHKYICKRNYSSRIVINKNSDVYNDYGEHYFETNIYKDNRNNFYVTLNNYTTTNKNVKCKLAEPGILHETKAVYIYDKEKILLLKTVADVKKVLKYLKNTKIDPNYTIKTNSDPVVNAIIEYNFKSVLENKYGCKDLVNLTSNITKDKDFNKVLFIIAKDLKNKKID